MTLLSRPVSACSPHRTRPGQFQFTIISTSTGTSWINQCNGALVLEYAAAGESEVEDLAVDAAWAQQSKFYKQLTRDSISENIDVDTFYEYPKTIGIEYRPLFRNVVSLSAIQLAGQRTAVMSR